MDGACSSNWSGHRPAGGAISPSDIEGKADELQVAGRGATQVEAFNNHNFMTQQDPVDRMSSEPERLNGKVINTHQPDAFLNQKLRSVGSQSNVFAAKLVFLQPSARSGPDE